MAASVNSHVDKAKEREFARRQNRVMRRGASSFDDKLDRMGALTVALQKGVDKFPHTFPKEDKVRHISRSAITSFLRHYHIEVTTKMTDAQFCISSEPMTRSEVSLAAFLEANDLLEKFNSLSFRQRKKGSDKPRVRRASAGSSGGKRRKKSAPKPVSERKALTNYNAFIRVMRPKIKEDATLMAELGAAAKRATAEDEKRKKWTEFQVYISKKYLPQYGWDAQTAAQKAEYAAIADKINREEHRGKYA